jgi:roadblock/LC7 domain-containing protein
MQSLYLNMTPRQSHTVKEPQYSVCIRMSITVFVTVFVITVTVADVVRNVRTVQIE